MVITRPKKTNKQIIHTYTHDSWTHKARGTLLLFAKTIDYSLTHFHTIITLYLNDVFHFLLIVFLLLDASVSYVWVLIILIWSVSMSFSCFAYFKIFHEVHTCLVFVPSLNSPIAQMQKKTNIENNNNNNNNNNDDNSSHLKQFQMSNFWENIATSTWQ